MTKEMILQTLQKQQGILFAKPAIVWRITYSGRDILAPNSKFEPGFVDERGYVPVEWWIMSMTKAGNAIPKEGEGITQLQIGEGSISLIEARQLCEQELFGNFAGSWPLTKILDIGGESVETSFGTKEVPPIPPHVHFGDIVNGKSTHIGKKEAYFFPPLNVSPYNKDFSGVITRLGLKQGIDKQKFLQSLKQFGKTDEMYELLEVYPIEAYDCWTIDPGIVHAPGPWVTFEIQKPQDDYNLCGWKLGMRLEGEEENKERAEQFLRGLENEEGVLSEVVNWEASVDPQFKEKRYHKAKVIEQGEWGRRLQIFFHGFYGEAIEVNPGQQFIRKATDKPWAGIIWSGKGSINNNTVDCQNNNAKEFLVTPNHDVIIKADEKLLIYSVFPILE